MVGRTATAGTWVTGGGGTGVMSTLTPDAGGVISPTAGNINVLGNSVQGVSTSNAGASTLDITVATTTNASLGVVRLSTNAEAIAGTDTTTAITPDDLTANLDVTVPVFINTKLGPQTPNCLLVGEGTANPVASMTIGAAGQVVQSKGIGFDPTWSTATYPSTTTIGQVLLSSATNTVSSSANIVSSAAGVITTVNQSGCSARLSAPIANFTGDLTIATIPFNILDYDIQSEFNATTGIFTAKTAGIYLTVAQVTLGNLTAAHDISNIQIWVNGFNIIQSQSNAGASKESANQFSMTLSYISKLAVSGTIQVTAQVGGSSKTVSILDGVLTRVQISKIA